jgi:glycosyltransferase involved in cell wall biosynthesis
MNYLVSVIIPTFNRSALLKRAIESVFSQTYKNWELIIIDNSSTDDSVMMVNKYNKKNIKVIKVNNQGIIAYSRNIGIKNAKGDVIAFLDSDDWWDSLKLEKCLIKLDSHKADVVYHNCNFLSENLNSKSNCRPLKANALEDLVINGNTLITSSVIVHKNLLLEVGSFSEDKEMVGWEDYHLWLKLAKKSYNFSLVKGSLANCWQGADNFDNPKRILINLIQIEKYFSDEFRDILQFKKIWWLSYTRGKAYLNVKRFKEARKSLNELYFNGAPFVYKLKSIYYQLFILFRN